MFHAPTRVLPEVAALRTINLHTHLEGSIRPETFWELAVEQKLELPFSQAEARRALQVSGEEKSLAEYLNKIAIIYPVLKNLQALERVSYEAAADAAQDGVVYLELRAGPLIHSMEGPPVEKIIESMLRGLKQAERRHAIVCRLIVAALRSHDPRQNLRLAKIAVEFAGEGVVAFDLAGDEANYPASLHREAIGIAREGGLGITIHAGEAGWFENVAYAVNELGATRIGHGVHSIQSEAVMKLLKDKKILLELCPTSNVHTRAVPNIRQHPVRRFFEYGIPIAIGDDDPITSDTRLSSELSLLKEMFGFTIHELVEIQLMALRAAFLESPRLRRALADKIKTPVV